MVWSLDIESKLVSEIELRALSASRLPSFPLATGRNKDGGGGTAVASPPSRPMANGSSDIADMFGCAIIDNGGWFDMGDLELGDPASYELALRVAIEMSASRNRDSGGCPRLVGEASFILMVA